MIPTLLLWSLTLAALCTSIFALFVAYRSSAQYQSKRLFDLSNSLREQSATLDTLAEQLKAMRQRENMRAYRNRRSGKSEELDEPDDRAGDQRDWVRKMNEQLALSRLGVRK
jgi:biopolymer transport protein ExbB/TolQ